MSKYIVPLCGYGLGTLFGHFYLTSSDQVSLVSSLITAISCIFLVQYKRTRVKARISHEHAPLSNLLTPLTLCYPQLPLIPGQGNSQAHAVPFRFSARRWNNCFLSFGKIIYPYTHLILTLLLLRPLLVILPPQYVDISIQGSNGIA